MPRKGLTNQKEYEMTNDQLKAIRELSHEQLIADLAFYRGKHDNIPKGPDQMLKEVRISSTKLIRAHAAELQSRIPTGM
jgi:hypothetical protein